LTVSLVDSHLLADPLQQMLDKTADVSLGAVLADVVGREVFAFEGLRMVGVVGECLSLSQRCHQWKILEEEDYYTIAKN
jgi:hypothetical protein